VTETKGRVLVPEWQSGQLFFRVFRHAETEAFLERTEAQFRFPAWDKDHFVFSVDTQAFAEKCAELYDENATLRALVGELVEGLSGVHDALNKAHESHMAEVQGCDRTVDRLEGEIKRYRDSVKALIAKAKEQVK